ncbi:MAG TPA: hypothetical protein VG722_09435, partial [Tepidisphaeraceae bacterium]|nr:hypothetical protein [Tepidisphaeraceae bacterium]
MAKMAVFKPIMWNDKGYVQPAGCPSTSGYSHDHGYGHEEWNNNPNWMWQGWRVFHTEATKTLEDAAHDGNLAMIMIAANGGMTYALGAAVGIFANDATQRPLIAAAVKKLNDSSKVWSLPTVQKQFAGNQNAFVTHWNAEYTWIRWRCLPQHFYWFPDPVKLNPVEISGKRKLVSEHSRFQETTPEV